MAKTETNVSTLKINRGTYAKIQENISSIGENELIITSDKNIPVPTVSDSGKAIVVNNSGEYELDTAGISQSDADARYLQLSGGTMSGAVAMGSNKITGLANGTAATDAAAFGQIPVATTTTPKMDGTASAGSSSNWSRGDHVHPTDTSRMAANLKGAANGVAELDANGRVPTSQLPSYVDDVVEYATVNNFPATGETGKIYVALNTNLTYRWGGTEYVEISSSLALGETSSTAYPGDKGAQALTLAAAALPKSGGTMTGSISMNNGTAIKGANNDIIVQGTTNINYFGSNKAVEIATNGNFYHNRGGSVVNVLDAYNTSANPTLAGTESALTGLKVNGTSYKIDSGISQTDADNRYLKLAGGTMSGAIAMGSNKITGLGTPTNNADAATKQYVDNGLSGKQNTLTTQTAYTAKGTATKVPQITTNNLGQVTGITEVDITDNNTWRPVNVNGTQVLPNTAGGNALGLTAGSNVTLTNSNGTVTISATDTTYESKSAASGGTDVSLVTTGEKYTWNNKQSKITTSGILKGNGSGTISAATAGTDYAAPSSVVTQASIDANGLITYKNSSGTSLFTLQLPLYNGGVS